MSRTWEWKSDEGDELIVEYRPGGTVNVIAHTRHGRQVGGEHVAWLEDGDREGEVFAELTGLPYAALKELTSAMARHRRLDVTAQPPRLFAAARTMLREMRRVDPEPVYPNGLARSIDMPLGSVSLAVRQLDQLGLVTSRWETEAEHGTAARPFRKYYSLTEAGRVYKWQAAG